MNIVISAVGGQGALFAARVIGRVALNNNYDVKVSEVHGMSQRGGSVITYVRFGKQIASPIVEEGYADVLLAFEMLEAARYVPYVKKQGVIIINDQKIKPQPVVAGDCAYPDTIVDTIRTLDVKVELIDATARALEAGSSRAVNAVMLGAFAKHTSFSRDSWIQGITDASPAKFVQSNIDAFDKGYGK